MSAHIVHRLFKTNYRDFPGMSRETRQRDQAPFYMVALTFLAALGMLGIALFWPYMIPFAVTIKQAAAPYSSLAFMFLGAAALVFPLLLHYAAINYTVVRSKAKLSAKHH